MPIKRTLAVVLIAAAVPLLTGAQGRQAGPSSAVVYGSNRAAGQTFVHDGVLLYYETYGTGEPLLMVHPNGGSIADLAAQIEHFRQRYRVIAMDSRDHGRSGDSPGRLTYEKMTDDLAALLDDLNVGPVNVLGWSDGGIEALLLGIRHPAKVRKLVTMAANLTPAGLHPAGSSLVQSIVADLKARATTPAGRRELKVTSMMLAEPNIDVTALEKIEAPTLVLASDHDVIADSHTLDIYHHVRNSQLAIFPDALHTIPFDDAATFNRVVERFLSTPFRKRDRIGETMKSLERLRTPVPQR
jgi:pimeloyl-ACP methyl ester carboxylesterase